VQIVKAGDTVQLIASKLNLVDLAGSERYTVENSQKIRNETIGINKSLTCLVNVIAALSSEKKEHVPYRDSKLTRLLKDSLGGNSKTLIVACISPAESNAVETISTLRYAKRAKSIKNRPIINEDPKDAVMASLYREIKKLKSSLQHGTDTIALRMMESLHQLPFFTAGDDPTLNAINGMLQERSTGVASVRERMTFLTSCLVQPEDDAHPPLSAADLETSEESTRLLNTFQEDVTKLYRAYAVADSRFRAAQGAIKQFRELKREHQSKMRADKQRLDEEKSAWNRGLREEESTRQSLNDNERELWIGDRQTYERLIQDLEGKVVQLTKAKLDAEQREKVLTSEVEKRKGSTVEGSQELLQENHTLKQELGQMMEEMTQLKRTQAQRLHSVPDEGETVLTDPKTGQVADKEYEEAVRVLEAGQVFLKYDAWDDLRDTETSRVTATVRNVYLSTEMSALVWCAVGEAPSQARSIPLSQVRGITLGKQSRSFVSIPSANVYRCFAIVGSNRTLSLEAKSRQARDAFLDSLLIFSKRRSLLTGRTATVVLDGNSRFATAPRTEVTTLLHSPPKSPSSSPPGHEALPRPGGSPKRVSANVISAPSLPRKLSLEKTPQVEQSPVLSQSSSSPLQEPPPGLSPTSLVPSLEPMEMRHSHPVLSEAKVLEISVRTTGCFRIRGDHADHASGLSSATSDTSFLVGVFENRANVPQWSFVEHTEKVLGTHDPVFLQKFVLTFVPSWGQQIMLSLYDMTEDGDKARERNRVGSACVDLSVLAEQPNQALSFQLTHFNDSSLDKNLQLHNTKWSHTYTQHSCPPLIHVLIFPTFGLFISSRTVL
jgi:hypothetical protein